MFFDCVVIPGGGVDDSGAPAAWVRARLDRALTMVSSTSFFLVLSRGTTHRPPVLDQFAFPVDEATASANYLIERNVAPEKILIENWSLDTIGNAYFARQCILEPMQLFRLALITNDFHLERSRMIFQWIFSLSSSSKERCEKFQIDYFNVTNQDMTDEQLIARISKERSACLDLKSKIEQLTTLGDVAKFLFVEHGAYRAKALQNDRAQLDPITRSTY